MSPEAQRIAIAEACGTLSAFYCPHCRETRDEKQRRQEDGIWYCNFCAVTALYHDSPNFLNDLNAMHEAEKLFSDDRSKWKKYSDWLMRLTQEANVGLYYSDAVNARYRSVNATAAQRCEAFLRTLGLWREE